MLREGNKIKHLKHTGIKYEWGNGSSNKKGLLIIKGNIWDRNM